MRETDGRTASYATEVEICVTSELFNIDVFVRKPESGSYEWNKINIHSKMVYPFLSVTIVGDTLPYIMKMTTIRWCTAQPDHVNVKVKVVMMV